MCTLIFMPTLKIRAKVMDPSGSPSDIDFTNCFQAFLKIHGDRASSMSEPGLAYECLFYPHSVSYAAHQ